MKALIVGATGQDGSLLSKHLLKKGYEVHGTSRRGSSDKFWRINELGIREKVVFHNYNVGNELAFAEILKAVNPDEIYSLAGESFTALSFEEPKHFMSVNIESTVEQLEAVRTMSPSSKVFFAGSAEVYGESSKNGLLDEYSPMFPTTPYGISKLTQLHLVRLYREKYDLKLSTGILFPHESPYRSAEFVTRKIVLGLLHRIYKSGPPLRLGDVSMVRDWGYAVDYVDLFWKILNVEAYGDFVIGTGINHSVEDFLLTAAHAIGLQLIKETSSESQSITHYVERDSKKIIAISDKDLFRANRFTYGAANVGRLSSVLGDLNLTSFNELVQSMVKSEFERLGLA